MGHFTNQQFMGFVNASFSSMEEGVEYLIKEEFWNGLNEIRIKKGFLKANRLDYPLKVQDNILFIGKDRIASLFEIKNMDSFELGTALTPVTIKLSFSLIRSFRELEKVKR